MFLQLFKNFREALKKFKFFQNFALNFCYFQKINNPSANNTEGIIISVI